VSIDPYDENRAHFEGWDATGVPLVYHHMVNRQVLATYPGPRFFFVTRDDPPVPLRPSKEASAFVGGGTVSFSALQVAHVLGANPVILLGQDFAFASGHTHAEGSASDVAFDPDVPSGERFLVPGTSGAPVLTNRVYRDYLLYMQEYLRHCASRRPGIVHINASKTGALIQGTEYKPLEEAIASAAPCDARAWADVTRSLLRQHEGVSEAARSAAVRQWHGEVRQIVDDSRVLTDCGGLLTAFAETSAGRQAGRMYADVAYLFEARYSQAPPDAREQFRARIEAHLRWLMDELARLQSDLAS
jgi:hypothetical protein